MSLSVDTIPRAFYPLGVGLLVTSSLFFGNVGLSLVGPLPIIKEEIGTSHLSTKSRVRIWRLFFDAATVYVVSGTAITIGLHLSVPFLAASSLTRNLALASAGLSASAIAYTVAAIQPTNAALIRLDQVEVFTEVQDKEASKLIAKWDWLHKIRVLIYMSAWATGLAGLGTVLA